MTSTNERSLSRRLQNRNNKSSAPSKGSAPSNKSKENAATTPRPTRMSVEEQIRTCYRQQAVQLYEEIPSYVRGLEVVELTGRLAGRVVVKVPVREPNERLPLRSIETYLRECEDEYAVRNGILLPYEPLKIENRAFICQGSGGSNQIYVAFYLNRTVKE